MMQIIEGIIVILAALLVVYIACKSKECFDRFER